MGAYEIQILDSSAIEPSKSPWKRANYADGQAGLVYEPATPELIPLLYQTGYLTITGSLREGVYTQYILGFPNDEVRHAFSKAVSHTFSHLPTIEHASLLTQMVEALRHDKVTLIDAAFDAEMRNLSDRQIEVASGA